MPKIPTSKVEFSFAYKSKLSLQQQLEALIRKKIEDGDITSQEELENFFQQFNAALEAIQSYPFEVYLKPLAHFK